ncbi:MAG: hypothetical protein ACYSUP_10990 [Planctomycetota bacterium]
MSKAGIEEGAPARKLDAKFDFLEKLEAAISGILAFIVSFLRTSWCLSYASRSVLVQPVDYTRFCRPYTYFFTAALLYITVSSAISIHSLSPYYVDDIPDSTNAISELLEMVETDLSFASLVRQAIAPAVCIWLVGSLAGGLLAVFRFTEKRSWHCVTVLCMAMGCFAFFRTIPYAVLFGFDIARAGRDSVHDLASLHIALCLALFVAGYGVLILIIVTGRGIYFQLKGSRTKKLLVAVPLAVVLPLMVALSFDAVSSIQEMLGKERRRLTRQIDGFVEVLNASDRSISAMVIIVNKGSEIGVVQVTDIDLQLAVDFERRSCSPHFVAAVAALSPRDVTMLPLEIDLPQQWSNDNGAANRLIVRVGLKVRSGTREEEVQYSGTGNLPLTYVVATKR